MSATETTKQSNSLDSFNWGSNSPDETEVTQRVSQSFTRSRTYGELGKADVVYDMGRTRQQHAPEVNQKNRIAASVSSIQSPMVHCELSIPGQAPFSINLHESIFPKQPMLGMPIYIEIIDDHGVRRPTVSIRDISHSKKSEESIELDALISKI